MINIFINIILIAAPLVFDFHFTDQFEYSNGKFSGIENIQVDEEIKVPDSPALLEEGNVQGNVVSEKKIIPKLIQPKIDPVVKKPTPKPVVVSPAPVIPIPPSGSSDCNSDSFNEQFICLLNNHRQANGKNILTYNSLMNTAAKNHSSWMLETGNFSHTGENGSSFVDRCLAVNVRCDGENIAFGFTSAQQLFDMWKNSPGHNANMLGDHAQLGIGIAGKYATTEFK